MKTKPEELNSGDWIQMQYGYELVIFYVLFNNGSEVILCSPNWLVTAAKTISYTHYGLSKFVYLGAGKYRWWWRFVPWRSLVVPFSRPSNLWWA